ncbi:mitochondrial 2-oxoglutarate/malate carrier protein, putative [Pediculus humanus corporis]|uniref:Mitochondrial 2-oxoglutarate/malate carrier protein, putative n=1 Tax=Pediculus humanus subsp. corporis TaxID=121224 RepID=E0VZ28_PEDHC|nr:mitochondrial 2-oxoglutarate/malate carrier protein, putative [Pediculus humanus corporis]EEB18634.1 mitochondrial 2-oxoglutarate/malate carrier protein, putative [Pediculus humanus corporis]
MEYATGAMAGVMAGCFTNPLDVVKTRMQLQGELKARGHHVVHYKNTLQAFYVIAKTEGIVSLQKGIVPALWFQVFLNGIRLGSFDIAQKLGWTKNKNNEVNVFKTAIVSACSGCLGSFTGSPFYLVKIHYQSHAASQIAVGYQHTHTGTLSALKNIFKAEGVRGLWRGSLSSLPRVGVGSSIQLSTFSTAKEFLENYKLLSKEKSLWNSFAASMLCGVAVATAITPFDVIQTRLYNQGVDKNGKGLLYNGIIDCFIKMSKTEGILGFFKGFGPCYLRIGPHSLLTLVFWDIFKKLSMPAEEKLLQVEQVLKEEIEEIVSQEY